MNQPLNNIRAGNNFDILRFLAACFVIISHQYVLVGRSIGEDILKQISNQAIELSVLGLNIFFIISGYLITKSLIYSPTYSNYFLKRALRIFPGMIGAILFCMIIVGACFTTHSLSSYFSDPKTWSFLRNIAVFKLQYPLPGVFESHHLSALMGSTWSLIYELMMYVVLALAFLVGLLKRKILLLLIFVFAIIVYILIKYYPVPPKFQYYLIHTDLDLYYTIKFGILFLSGVLFYLYKDIIVYKNLYAFLVLLAWAASWYVPIPFNEIGHFLAIPYLTFWLAFHPKLSFSYNFGKYGDFSYGIYLYGMACQQMLIAMLGADFSFPILMVLSIAFSFVLAFLSWHLIEKPVLNLKKRL